MVCDDLCNYRLSKMWFKSRIKLTCSQCGHSVDYTYTIFQNNEAYILYLSSGVVIKPLGSLRSTTRQVRRRDVNIQVQLEAFWDLIVLITI